MLELKNVSCGYDSTRIFRNISFSVMRGQTLCLLGPNGVGKTTLFKTILGLLPPLAGEILLSGENMSAWTVEERAHRVAYVPQTHAPVSIHSPRYCADGAGRRVFRGTDKRCNHRGTAHKTVWGHRKDCRV